MKIVRENLTCKIKDNEEVAGHSLHPLYYHV